MTTHLLFAFCILSFVANTVLAWLVFSRKRQKKMTIEANEFLSDILRGGALVRVVRVAPEDVFLRRPSR